MKGIYNLLVLAANGWHGLTPNNRKFYWNSKENFFEPINSDTNANIELEANFFPLPASEKIEFAFSLVSAMNLDVFDRSTFNNIPSEFNWAAIGVPKGPTGVYRDHFERPVGSPRGRGGSPRSASEDFEIYEKRCISLVKQCFC